jgi:hypothetical protein
LLATLWLTVTVAACSAGSGHSNGTSAIAEPGHSGNVESTAPLVSSTVSGRIYWPDGTPAMGVPIDIYPNGYPFGGQYGDGLEINGKTDGNGQYSITGCGCSSLGIELEIPAQMGNNDPVNGGNPCYIIMQTQTGSLTQEVSPGDRVNWVMVNMLCSADYITPDSLASVLETQKQDPYTNSSGTWQAARNRAGG